MFTRKESLVFNFDSELLYSKKMTWLWTGFKDWDLLVGSGKQLLYVLVGTWNSANKSILLRLIYGGILFTLSTPSKCQKRRIYINIII